MTPFVTNFYRLCSQKNVSPSSVCEKLGLNKAVLKKWREGSLPHYSTIQKIADYFGVPASGLTDPDFKPDYATVKEPKSDFTDQEKTLLSMFRGTTEEGRLRMIQALMNIHDEEEKKKKAASKGAAG